jgi:hypothetical protein
VAFGLFAAGLAVVLLAVYLVAGVATGVGSARAGRRRRALKEVLVLR